MEESSPSISSRAFGDLADPGLIVSYQSHTDALQFLTSELEKPGGVIALQGPGGAGKTTIAEQQRDWSSRHAAVALFDGLGLTPRRLTSGMLSQFDIRVPSDRNEEQLQAVGAFLSEHTKNGRTPILILDDADRIPNSTLPLLNWLAALEVRGTFALRIILTGKHQVSTMLKQDALRNLARRNPRTFSLNPLTSQEAVHYLRTRFIAAGGTDSEKVFSIKACENFRAASCGWPGALNDLAERALERRDDLHVARDDLPLAQSLPRVTISRDGVNTAEIELSERQYVIGRTELADIIIDDKYASKMHAILQIYPNAVLLVDLNSTNGTTVNSIVVHRKILREDDVITLGRYRIKIENVPAITPEMDKRIKASDTLKMKHLGDIRRLRARRNIKATKGH